MKAVYYCRVSTEEMVQVDALEKQIKECIDCIEKKQWVLVDGYVDEGKSGTQTRHRNEYNRLFRDIESNLFDVIVIKSQDRLMRNTLDWYIFIDRLLKNGKKLYMYIENQFYTTDDALLTGIRAILAEEYSRELSKKINNAHQHRQQISKNVIITSSTWGYDNVNKNVTINEKEAEIVRTMFELCIEGMGSRCISKELAARGMFTRYNKPFAEVTIRKILRNPLYYGTAIMNKYHKDFTTKKVIANPKEEWIYVEQAVPPIVSKEIWDKANQCMDQRLQKEGTGLNSQERKGKNKGKGIFSGKLICGECGEFYWRKTRKLRTGERVDEWYCKSVMMYGRDKENGCSNIVIKEKDLLAILGKVADEILEVNRDAAINKIKEELNYYTLKREYETELKRYNDEKQKIKKNKDVLLDKLLDGVVTDEQYREKNDYYNSRLRLLEEKKKDLVEHEVALDKAEDQIKRCVEFLERLECEELKVEELVRECENIRVDISKIVLYGGVIKEIEVFIQKNRFGIVEIE